MKLTATIVLNAKPESKARKLGDGDGLYLHVKPSGVKIWRMKYHHEMTEKVWTIGPYPEISLAKARDRRFEARKLLAEGIDPVAFHREQQRKKVVANNNSFQHIALEWHETKSSSWTDYYAHQVNQRLQKDIFPKLGHKPINAITAKDVLDMARTIESREAHEIAHRAVQMCGQVFLYGIITGRAENNPAAAIRGVLKTSPRVHHAYLEHKELP
ncbi:MAG TPA: integrase arm-type DNA-binding domain-containing protein, partial [Candidatus Angelobacter sp.]|nr:integrase arm-type DNA-binding domain-containing protein [Candidatus Angelobacter sp.]